jgi:hypothetical protein
VNQHFDTPGHLDRYRHSGEIDKYIRVKFPKNQMSVLTYDLAWEKFMP